MSIFKSCFTTLFLLLYGTSCLHHEDISTSSPEAEEMIQSESENEDERQQNFSMPTLTWGDNQKVYQYADFYISGQPHSLSVLFYKAHNIKKIIDLRPVSNEQQDLNYKSKNFNLIYISLPILTLHHKELEMLKKELIVSPEMKTILVSDPPDIAACLFAAFKGNTANLNFESIYDLALSLGLKEKQWNSICQNFYKEMDF